MKVTRSKLCGEKVKTIISYSEWRRTAYSSKCVYRTVSANSCSNLDSDISSWYALM